MRNSAAPGFGNENEAMGAVMSGMGYLAGSDPAALPAAVKAGLLKDLERAGGLGTIARARLIRSFDASCDYEGFGQVSMSAFLVNETGITKGEAAGYRTWTRTVLEHPAVAGLLADGLLTRSWLGKITLITGKIREDRRSEAEALIAQLARDGQLGPRDLFRVAAEIRDRAPAADPRDDGDRGFEDRSVRLETTLDGAGKLTGDLSPECAAALGSLLGRFAVKRGADDTRTQPERNHDALMEVCLRLLGSDLSRPTPGAAPVQMIVTASLADLYALDDGSALTQAWIDRAAAWFAGQRAANAETGGGDGSLWATGPAARGLACDAALFPIITGHVDTRHLDQLITQCVQIDRILHPGTPADGPAFTPDRGAHQARITELMRQILGTCAKILGGEPGLAAHLRRNLLGHLGLGGASLPLDVGDKDEVPWHLRRAVHLRDGGQCQWAGGCGSPAATSHPHHLDPRASHGPTSLQNLQDYCPFHHLVAMQAINKSRLLSSMIGSQRWRAARGAVPGGWFKGCRYLSELSVSILEPSTETTNSP
jgi:Domain of unknown function (DUF222)